MSVKHVFQPEIRRISLAEITSIKTITPGYRKTETYKRIAASIAHVGVIEPLVVFPSTKGTYVLLDGHTRLDILNETGVASANCLLATDNESYTYNKRVNFIPPVAQHHMILRALTHVSEERIAEALHVTVATIREKRDLLRGICPEAVGLLKNERVAEGAFNVLRKMKPVRQIDAARLMVSAQKFSGLFARALLNGTREELLVQNATIKRCTTPTEQSIMEHETEELLKNLDSIKANYGNDVLNLTAVCKHLQRILANSRIRRYLEKRHEDSLSAVEHLLGEIVAEKRRPSNSEKRQESSSKSAVARPRPVMRGQVLQSAGA